MNKRILDIVISIGLLCLLTPVFLILAVLIKLKLGSPIFFRQTRPGLHGKPFELFKFRTMLDAKNAGETLLPDHLRITKFGQFLRASSLDELPELWNVLKGDMSLVGPRPLLMEYLSLYSPEQMRRHDIKPGITGWAQVNGRNAISWEEKFTLDLDYIRRQSLWMDITILCLTIKNVLLQKDIWEKKCSTVYPFTGSHNESKNI